MCGIADVCVRKHRRNTKQNHTTATTSSSNHTLSKRICFFVFVGRKKRRKKRRAEPHITEQKKIVAFELRLSHPLNDLLQLDAYTKSIILPCLCYQDNGSQIGYASNKNSIKNTIDKAQTEVNTLNRPETFCQLNIVSLIKATEYSKEN